MNPILWVSSKLPRSWLDLINRWRWHHPASNKLFDLLSRRLRNKDARIQRGAGAGLWLNAGPSNAGYILGIVEPDVQEAFVRLIRPGMVVYDIGANVGFLSMIAARLTGASGTVVCLEPQKRTVELIQHNAALNGFQNVQVIPYAAGGRNGEARLRVPQTSTLAKIVDADEAMEVSNDGTMETIAIRRIDTLIAENNLPKPDLIKMDVEGAEADVLLGASELIRSSRPILLIELHGTNRSIAELLEDFGYTAYVLGDRLEVRQAPWNAHVLAVPPERADLREAAVTLTHPALAE